MQGFIRFFCLLSLFAYLPSSNSRAKSASELLLGSWIKTRIQAKTGEELPITFRSKKAYLRFSFYKNGQGFKSVDFRDKGFAMAYAIKSNTLVFGINTYTVESIDSAHLVLLEEASAGTDEPAIRYTFTREQQYQNTLPAEQETAVYRRDKLVYKESQKLTPELQLKSSLDAFLLDNISALHASSSVAGFFVASFVVLPSGKLDTIQIHKGRNQAFDKQFVKAIRKTDGLWRPAMLDGNTVAVEKEIRFKFSTFATRMDYDQKYNMAIKLKNQGEYQSAIALLSVCIQLDPYEIDAYYHRATCYQESNQIQNACTDWQQVKTLGSKDADEWLAKFCK
ncbi:energy transducer TonB [Hymenobacter jeongseonensis]|nr:energy transducer TonB [Hymenobacter jeongseonensis]